ncbi:hypothetical protein RHGRI_036446 [Rhododendron griersonianum]|uniref:Uncharacterized protein n=1 Tax=Rhododendron griersonianum TaxID=479676 RepID=A0AAV6HNT3_9ERIC|nr:hypothetical protein RHGRI_036446 [Rhododendron griersonianum]
MNLGSRIQKSTPFFPECTPYFDWQTVGLIHSFYTSGQPGNITRLLSCTDEDLKNYKGRDLAPTHYVPSMSRHPLTGDWYPAINKPTAVLHWLNHANVDAEFIVILDANTKLGHARPRSTVRAGQRTITLSSKKKERTITLAKISIEEQPNFNLLGKEKLEESNACFCLLGVDVYYSSCCNCFASDFYYVLHLFGDDFCCYNF